MDFLECVASLGSLNQVQLQFLYHTLSYDDTSEPFQLVVDSVL